MSKSPTREEFQVAIAVSVLNLAFLSIAGGVLWMLGLGGVALRLAAAYAALWAATFVSTELLSLGESLLKIDIDRHDRAYVRVNLAVCVLLTGGWGIYTGGLLAFASVGVVLLLVMFVIGFLASYIAFAVVTTVYNGSLYKVVSLPLVLIVFVIAFVGWTVSA